MLSVLTFADLRAEINAARARATSASKKQGWDTLTEIVGIAESTPRGANDFDPAADSRQWWLLRVDIEGFRGISSTALSLEFEPTPGVTVIHGPNGSGKSSICDAIDVALHQNADASLGRLSGRGGRAPVWEPVLLHTESSKASFRVQLLSTDNQLLTLHTHIGAGAADSISCTLTRSQEPEHPISVGEAWKSALTAYSPTYAYATWEQRIQFAQDLQRYLERMLVLGGCFSAVDQIIEDKKRASAAADGSIKTARREAEGRLLQAEREFGRKSKLHLGFELDDDPDAWWVACGFQGTGTDADPGFAPIQTDSLTDLAAKATSALSAFPQEASADVATIHALHQLQTTTEALGSDPTPCPVCGKPGPWRERLSAYVRENEAAISAVKEWALALSSLLQEANAVMPALQHAGEPAEHEALTRAIELLDLLNQHLALAAPAAPQVRTAGGDLLELIASAEFGRQAVRAIKRASAESAWLRRQSNALRAMYEEWKRNRATALELRTWEEARRCLDDLAKRLKARRQESLEAVTNTMVTSLLRDAGLKVSQLSVQKIQADLILQDVAGRKLELGMLSAGQRNAVLLAPALAVAERGPFRFMVIDDPVHAFDELRVDQISRHIVEMSKSRRVIVLTHDERLREHLLAAPTQVDSRSVRRDTTSGRVEVEDVGPMWSVLLEDAESLVKLAGTGGEARKLLSNTVRGLCRQAVDNALRLLVTREAVRSLIDPHDWLGLLDAPEVATTGDRLDAVQALPLGGRAGQVVSARATLAPFLKAWNMAAHGNEPELAVTPQELQAARDVCAEIVR